LIKRISIYGKGGVGKSTVTTNLAACLQSRGYNSSVIGCSPKADSTYLLLKKLCRPTILEIVKEQGVNQNTLQQCMQYDERGILCLETGGPEPAAGCAGRGVSLSLQLLSRFKLLENANINLAIYDVIADVVCGGFSEPMRRGYASLIYLVTSGELMSLYAANNICNAIVTINNQTGNAIKVGGIILNERGLERESELVGEFASYINVPVITRIPRSSLVQQSEAKKQLVIEKFPDSEITNSFFTLADGIITHEGVTPTPMETTKSIEIISSLVRKFGTESFDENTFPITVPSINTKKRLKNNPVKDYKHELDTRRIAIYGKAGIGKSTISANLSASLMDLGEQVLQIGCDPKRDSVALLTHRMVPTVLEKLKEKGPGANINDLLLDDVIFRGFNGTYCVESGSPTAGMGCAGQGVFISLEYLEKAKVFSRYNISFALFDILGDVVCGGFAQPIRGGFCKEIYVVTNGEPLSLVVTNNIFRAMHRLHEEGIPVGVAGIINNQRGITNEQNIVEAFAMATGVPVIAHIPRSTVVQQAESLGQTVIESFPGTSQALIYRTLAEKILSNKDLYTPQPLKDINQVFQLFATQNEIILDIPN